MPGKHAEKSPSSSHRWGGRDACTASIGAQKGKPDNALEITRTGSTGHQIVDECLSAHLAGLEFDTHTYIGWVMCFYADHSMGWDDPFVIDDRQVLHRITVDEKLAEQCDTHISFVLERVLLTGGTLYVEDRVPIDHITDEADAHGSTDTAIVYGSTCEIIDLKLGGREVKAYDIVTPAGYDLITGDPTPEVVEPNSQVAMYWSGTARKLADKHTFTDAVLTISQPSVGKVSQWSGTVAEVDQLMDRLRRRSWECDNEPVFRPSGDNCLYCRASGQCDAQTQAVFELAVDGLDDVRYLRPKTIDISRLGNRYAAIPMVLEWAKSTETATRQALNEGRAVVREDGIALKLVEGKLAPREWDDAAEAEATVAKMRLKKEMTHTAPVLKSPTQLAELWTTKRNRKKEVVREAVIGEIQANRIKEHIKQGRTAPQIVLETDPRPPLASATDGFEDEAVVSDDLF